MKKSGDNYQSLPWWTLLISAAILQGAIYFSLIFKYDQGVSSFYLPTAFAIVLIHWWGPKRVLPLYYLLATLNTFFWGVENWLLWPLYAVPEVLAAYLSYFLFCKLAKGKYWLPNTRQFLLFTVLGILLPITVELILLQTIFTITGQYEADTYLVNFIRNWLGEFMACFGITVTLLFVFTPYLQRKNLLAKSPAKNLPLPKTAKTTSLIEIGIVYAMLLLLSVVTPFDKFWFAYGVFSLYIAIRFGFRAAIYCNLYVFFITYVLPVFYGDTENNLFTSVAPLYTVFLGNILLSFFVALTGRVISDLRIIEKRLSKKNEELETANNELDRFVYSASHDLSAPLKSILGLVTISKMDTSPDASKLYLNEIERSVVKLDTFIAEILDYSRNKRSEVVPEQIKLHELCQEILDNLRYMEGYDRIQFDMNGLQDQHIRQDKTRLKIILNNLLSNAIKFQRYSNGHEPRVTISSRRKNSRHEISIADNGEGIRPEYRDKVFNMFYRASENAKGSGLGLYIARESVMKIGGKINLETEFGKGSVFTIELPELT
ncbi:MAG: ATP-binding protein [Cyclobacteriaceae bacterium]|nr:ATP-binding protein [Cyclobacteriaceae bacterium]